MSVSTDILDGIAAILVAGVSGTSYNPSGATVDNGIVRKLMPATPDRVWTLNVVPQGESITMPLGQVMIQIRTRGLPNDPTGCDDMLDAAKIILHGSQNLVLGTATLIQLNWRVRAPMGMDQSKRWEAVDQYYADINVPPTALRPASGSW